MAQLRQDAEKFSSAEIKILVAGPETQEEFKIFWDKERLPFFGLPDPEKNLLNAYGQEFKLHKLGRMPAQFFIDKNGIICLAHYGKSMKDILDNKKVLSVARKIVKSKS